MTDVMKRGGHEDAVITDVSSRLACLAIQGPKATEIARRVAGSDIITMKRFTFGIASIGGGNCDLLPDLMTSGKGNGTMCMFARTGYTGEDGFEITVEECGALHLWDSLVKEGGDDLELTGLGCRDTLRLEKGMLLSGTDFDDTKTVLQTGPPWVVKFDHDFVGREALEAQRESGKYDVLAALMTEGRSIPRHGYDILKDGGKIGTVTSGTLSPVIKRGIALGYVPMCHSSEGTELEIDVRGRSVKAVIVKLPFV
jgi:aminomethyltransferase